MNDTQLSSATESKASGDPAAAEETKTADVSVGAASEKDPNERICKRTKSTGSNFTRRRCQTRAEWDQDAKEARDALDRLDQKNREGCTAAQNC